MLNHAHPNTPLEVLQRYFGYREFRPGQEEIIRSALSRHDTLVVMPTGGGKSLCYQVPALLLGGVTIVISPLIALMKDQVDALARAGIRATTINSTLDFATVRQRMTDIRYGMYRLVYVAPERFESPTFLEMIKDIEISLFAVDEAHCISEWGHDFRPSYIRLREAAESLGRPPIIALTATATPFVQEDVINQLGLVDPKRFVRGFDRPNLSYSARYAADKDGELRDIMRREMERDGAVVIYCGTRKNVEAVGMMLHAERLPVTIYHAGMLDDDRRAAQDAFIEGRVKAIVATNAFGMGIDKANVRHVIHYDMPGSIEAYYQEAGRAGRDGLPSSCTLLYGPRDRRLQEFFIRSSFPERDQLESLYEAMWDLLHIGVGNRYEGVFVPDERELAARSRIHPAACAWSRLCRTTASQSASSMRGKPENTMSAASGSNQALNSACGVTLPRPVTAPPITTQRAMRSGSVGSSLSASATLVSGPSATSSSFPACSCERRSIASAACSLAAARAAGV